MDIPIPVSITILVLSVLFTAFFSLSETAYACVNKYKYRAKAKQEKQARAKVVAFMADRFESTLITVLIGNNVFSIFISVFSTYLFYGILHQYIDETLLSLLVSILMAFIIFLFGDTIPKILAKRMPDTFANLFAYPLLAFYILFFPLQILFKWLNDFINFLFRSKKRVELTEDDLKEALEEAEEDGLLEENESDIIAATLEMDDIRVATVLTPLKKMLMIDAYTLNQEKLLGAIRKCPYSRIPVYYKDRNKIIGILVVKDYLQDYFSSPKALDFTRYLNKPVFVKPSIRLDDLIEVFQENRTQIAIVRRNETVLGMVTTEDALEKLVGDIEERKEFVGGEAR